jgi:YidC/Oxa1 family membrane protein insertase
MEKRAILAAVLMAALLIVYQTFFLPTAPPPDQQAQAPKPTAAPAPPPITPRQPVPAPVQAPAAPSAKPAPLPPPQRTASVDSPIFHADVSSEGGKLLDWTLHYRGKKPMIIVGEFGPQGIALAPNEKAAAAPVSMTITRDGLRLTPEKPTDSLVLTGESDGLLVRETLTFDAATFAYETRVRVENPSATARTVTVTLPWTTRTDWRGVTEKFLGQHPSDLILSSEGRIRHLETLTDVPDQLVEGQWIAMGSVWYLAAFIPKSPDFKLVTHSVRGAPAKAGDAPPVTHVTMGVTATPTIAPGQAWEGTVVAYIGPKEYRRLAVYGLEGTINFGGFPIPRRFGGLPMEWLGIPILQLMNWVYRHVGNYGVAIILLTVLSKVLFYPLTVKSMRSMKAMQALQPQINALRSKYKSDPQRLQRETLDLYRKHKVNPAGGCLPMIAQIPIFYGLYLALSVSVELQGATFLCFGHLFGMDLWICDLASHDPTYVLPVLMGVTMFIQQKMTPVAGDPRQAKMMLVMPFVFTFMFINLPAGLVLYWTVSNVLQIAQQWSMERSSRRARAGENKAADSHGR